MNLIKVLLTFLICVALPVALSIWLYKDNSQIVDVVLFSIEMPSLPLAMWLGITFVIGLLLGIASSFVPVINQSVRIRSLQKQLSKQSDEG